jgi:cytochrome c553
VSGQYKWHPYNPALFCPQPIDLPPMKKTLIASLFVAAFLAAPAVMAQDAKAGEKKAAMCIGCHGIPGYQASFPEVHKVPMISGQNEKYLVNALAAYKKGERKHPTMRAIATSLSDQDMADLAKFYAAQVSGKPVTPVAPPADVAKLLEKGGCAACHGTDYNKVADPSYPKLAGQHADYLYVALKSYRNEGAGNVGRGNAIMGGMVKQFSNAELKQIANYLGGLQGEMQVVPQPRFR